jgi:hypothetical protein
MNRRCLGCGALTPTTRCRTCALAYERNLYGAAHRRERARWSVLVAAGGVACWRCGRLIVGDFDLGHRPGLPSAPEHPRCNRVAQ